MRRTRLPLKYEDEINGMVKEIIEYACELYDHNFTIPKISYNVKGRCAGKADTHHWEIKLNLEMMMQNLTNGFIKDTVPHEVAHLIAGKIRPGCCPHGFMWKKVMFDLGHAPDRCHHYDTSTLDIKRVRKGFMYKCVNCGKEYNLTLVRHNKILRGKVIGYQCRCHGKLSYVGSK